MVEEKLSAKVGVSNIRWLFRVFISSGDRFYWDNGFSKAAALAYASLLSLVPLTVLCFGILGAFVASSPRGAAVLNTGQTLEQGGTLDPKIDSQTQVAAEEIQKFLLQQFIPPSAFDADLVNKLGDYSTKIRELSDLVILALVVTSLLLLNSIEYTLNQVWQVYQSRSLTDRIAIFCAIIILIPLFAVSGYYSSKEVATFVAGIGVLGAVYQDVLPFLIDFMAFVALYYLVPKAPVKIGSAFFGAFCAAALFGVAKFWFATYLVTFASYSAVYGVASVPVFLFWLYISWSIVLFGAELSYQFQNLPRLGALWSRSLVTVGDGAMLLAVQALVLIERAFSAGGKLPNEIELAEQLGCSSVVLKPSLDNLEQAGILMRGDSRDMPLLLAKSPNSVSIDEIRSAVFKRRSSMILTKELSAMYHYLNQVQLSESKQGTDQKEVLPTVVTLADLAKA